MTEREAFEQWAASEDFCIHRDETEKYSDYHRATTRWAWQAWQARAVLADRASRSPVVGAVGGEPTEEQKDAARYRWLRAKTAERHEDFYADVDRWSVSKERRGTGQCFSSDRLDAVIDAAMGGIGVSPTGSPEGEVSNG